jgi:3-oxoacyl-[acyl-carrier-protein] synthase III
MSIGILGAGRALGSRIHTNEELAATAGVTPEWIVTKTGIRHRLYATEGQTTSTMAVNAAWRAIGRAGIQPGQIGLTIGCTFTHDYMFPPLSAKLHRDLGLTGGQFYDLQANCSGYVSALVAATDRIRARETGYALVVGAELLSPLVDPTDAEASMYFSDGAGAVVLGWRHLPSGMGLVSTSFHADTSNYESVRCLRDGLMEMSGIATWKQAMMHLPDTIRIAVNEAGWEMSEVDLFIPHQANLRLIEFLASWLGWADKVFTNVAEVGNTGAASIPIAIADAFDSGTLHERMKVVIAGIGAGFGFGATCWQF